MTQELEPAVESILAAARDRDPPAGRVRADARSLTAALTETEGRPTVAEVKPTSPTTDVRRAGDPAELARGMVAGGAAAISVLTEPEHFDGSPGALRQVREAVDVPVLRKDFVLEERELDRVPTDAVLLIVRFLDDLEGMIEAARERGMTPLVEVHTREELAAALSAGADLVGVNNRDLRTLSVDLGTVERLAPEVPDDVTLIAESGISGPEDADRMLAAGADGLLVGSAIMGDAPTPADVEQRTREVVDG